MYGVKGRPFIVWRHNHVEMIKISSCKAAEPGDSAFITVFVQAKPDVRVVITECPGFHIEGDIELSQCID